MTVSRLLVFVVVAACAFLISPGARPAAQASRTGTQGLIHHYNGGAPGPCFCVNADLWVGNDIPLPVCAGAPPIPAVRPGVPGGNNAVMVINTTWGPTLVLGHPHGAAGPVSVRIRTTCINGPCLTGPCGVRTETLISGTLLSTIATNHNGVSAVVPSQNIPNNLSLIGLAWACQATVVGGGLCDYSSALLGVIGDKF